MTSSARDIAVFRRYLEAVSGGDIDLEVLDETLAEDVVHHGLPEENRSGRSGMKAQQESFGSTWADRDIEIEDVVASDGLVAARLLLTARHVGEFGGIEASGIPVQVEIMAFARIEDGRISEWWEVADVLGLIEQLGVSPLK
ncbi:ester cyclase [Actinomycetota bacterium]